MIPCRLIGMTREVLALALEAEGIKPEKQSYAIAEDRDATALIGGTGEFLSIDRVVRVEARDKYVLFETGKRERFFFPYEVVLGLKLLAGKERAAGFGR